ncbi:hypothetical protein NUSPORA_00496 [Nucleospora cyclopteri]
MLGKRADVEEYTTNSALFNYLLGFEFSETVIVVKEIPIVFTSQRKAMILQQLGEELKITLNQSRENPRSLDDFIGSLGESYIVVDRGNIKGDFCNRILQSIRTIDGDEELMKMLIVKEAGEITNVHKSGIIANFLLTKAIELCRDGEFSKENLERFMNSPLKGIDSTAIEFAEEPEFSNDFVRIGIRYKGYCTEVGRRFMCDLTEEYEIQRFALSCIRPGEDSADVLQSVKDFVDDRGLSKEVTIFTKGLLPIELDFSAGFKLKENIVFCIRIDNVFSNTFVLEDSPLFITKKDSKEEYTVAKMKFRNKANEIEVRTRIKEHQKELLSKLIDQMQAFYVNNDISKIEKNESVKKIDVYQRDAEVPRSSRVSIDFDRFFVFLPVLSYSIPFHISCIKNASVSNTGNGQKLRINFKESKEIKEIQGDHFYDTSIKSISVLCSGADELLGRINELKREYNRPRVNVREQGVLRERQRKIALTDLVMKTDYKVSSRKNTSSFELHENGFKYNDCHFLFSNIKHVFYQLGDYENYSLVHFNLKEPIMVNGKPTRNLQFHKKQARNYHETSKRENEHMALLRQQEEEDEIYRINKEISTFIEKIENETPFRPQLLEKGFYGVYHKEASQISVTNDCLASVQDTPFFILCLDEVEIINLERVTFSTKTFDCVFVLKDKTKQPVNIGAIETTKLNWIKSTFDNLNLVFMETKVNINWSNLMATIMKDPIGFYESGGWTELMVEEEEEQTESEDSESAISSSEEDVSEGDETDISSEVSSETVDGDESDATSSFVESDSDDEDYNSRRMRR